MRHHDVDHDRPGPGAQQEPRRQQHHVEDHDPFEAERVGQVQHQVGAEHEGQPVAQQHRAAEGTHNQQGRRRPGGAERQASRRDGAPALVGVQPIGLAIRDVVDQVDGGGDQPEEQERPQHAEDVVHIGHLVRKDKRGQNKNVLDPMVQAHRPQQLDGNRRHLRTSARRRTLY